MKKKYSCCEDCLFYKQYYTLHNYCLVKEDRGICCRTGELCFVEDVCEKYESLQYIKTKSAILEKVQKIRFAEKK